MDVRRLGAGDETHVEAVCRQFGARGPVDAAAFLDRPETVLFVVDDEAGRVAGWVYGHELVHPDGERTMLLYALDVVEGARRQGCGTRLVTTFVDHARDTGCTEVWVLTEAANEPALATYLAADGERDPAELAMFAWPFGAGPPP